MSVEAHPPQNQRMTFCSSIHSSVREGSSDPLLKRQRRDLSTQSMVDVTVCSRSIHVNGVKHQIDLEEMIKVSIAVRLGPGRIYAPFARHALGLCSAIFAGRRFVSVRHYYRIITSTAEQSIDFGF